MSKEDKTALITGGTGGIGKKILYGLAKIGINNIFFTFFQKEEQAEILAKEISRQYSIHCANFKCDVSKYSDVESVVNEIISQTGSIGILINNAGIVKNKFWLYMSEDEWNSVINVNLKGSFNCIKAVARHMIRNKYGRIVNISSVAGTVGSVGQVNYSASKAGIIGLTKTAALEFNKYNIKTFTVIPGMIETEMNKSLTEIERRNLLRRIPMGRFGEPEDVANAINFLISDKTNLINGYQFFVDGGLNLAYEFV